MSFRYVFLGRYCCFVAVVIAFPFDNDFLWNYFCLIIVKKKMIKLVDMIFMLDGYILKIR